MAKQNSILARRPHAFLGALLLAVFPTAVRADLTLTDVQGRKATIEIAEASLDRITFLLQGRKGVIKMADLTEESRAAAVAYARSKGVYRSFPALNVQVKIANQRRQMEGSWYRKNVKLVSSVVIEGAAKLVAVPPAEASLVIITQDTREKYAHQTEKLEVYATDTISIPEGAGARREFPFKIVEMSLDTARDPTNVGGDEYKYFIFGLRDPATKELVDFQTNCPMLEKYVAMHPESRETFLAAREKAPFDPKFAVR